MRRLRLLCHILSTASFFWRCLYCVIDRLGPRTASGTCVPSSSFAHSRDMLIAFLFLIVSPIPYRVPCRPGRHWDPTCTLPAVVGSRGSPARTLCIVTGASNFVRNTDCLSTKRIADRLSTPTTIVATSTSTPKQEQQRNDDGPPPKQT